MDYSIKELRDRNGFSERELATKLGVDEGEVRAWEAGTVTPSHDQLTKLSEIFSVAPAEIQTGSPAATRS